MLSNNWEINTIAINISHSTFRILVMEQKFSKKYFLLNHVLAVVLWILSLIWSVPRKIAGRTDKTEWTFDSLIDFFVVARRPGTFEEHTKYSRIWKKLESIETTPALSMHWKNSSLFQNYLKTINIIQQNLVRTFVAFT